jgi:hypothetical protein
VARRVGRRRGRQRAKTSTGIGDVSCFFKTASLNARFATPLKKVCNPDFATDAAAFHGRRMPLAAAAVKGRCKWHSIGDRQMAAEKEEKKTRICFLFERLLSAASALHRSALPGAGDDDGKTSFSLLPKINEDGVKRQKR